MVRTFVDASVFFAACYSERRASAAIFRHALQDNVHLVISEFVLQEVARNLARKSPEDLGRFEVFRDNVPFELVAPSREEVLSASKYTELKDAPIVAAAIRGNVDALVSLDRRHLVGRSEVAQGSGLRIVLPEELLEEIRRQAGDL
jgi:predicted nucleic acid-binding protein